MENIISPADSILVKDNATFRDAITTINNAHSGVAFVVNDQKKLVGILTDGDIRTAIIRGITLDEPVNTVMTKNPITVSTQCTRGEIWKTFANKKISHLPVVNEKNTLVGIIYESILREEGILNIPVVIMAGGFGRRLRPLTDNIPKPMLKIGGKPILQILVEKFRDLGVSNIYITINYLADIIENYFMSDKNMKVDITWVKEQKPLGTAGSLILLPRDIGTEFLLINADVITNFDFKDMHNFHIKRGSDLTVAIKRHELQIPYGAVTVANERLMGLFEKPVLNLYVNAGIYIINPELVNAIPENTYFDMTYLIDKLLKAGKKVFSYMVDGQWIDIGHPSDYERATKEFNSFSNLENTDTHL